MCGICGIVKFNENSVDEASVRIMMNVIRHRGPDDEGVYIDGNFGLGFLRLSILDLSPLGHQPMLDSTGRYAIIHNGEVYNFIEVREELIRKGYKFRSNSDTEVILYSYIEWGEDCLHKFNGMWAFCIYDNQQKELFISRDRYGVKPFYYYLDKDRFIFASEIPSILSVLDFKVSANNQAIFDYLVFNRTDQTQDTFFSGIKKLQHGHCLKITGKPQEDTGSSGGWTPLTKHVSVKKWYDLKEKVKNALPFSDAPEFRETLSSSIGLRLRSDVPVGVCLSGGLDSSSITSVLLKDYDKKDLNTFSAVYGKGKKGDETEFIEEYRPQLTNMFFTSPGASTLFDDMHAFVKAHGEPVPSTAPYAQFKVMQLVKGNVVVTLDGQGADEELAGYHYFFGFYFKDLLRKGRIFKFLSESGSYIKKHRSTYGLKTLIYFLLPGFLKTKARVGEKGYLKPEYVDKYSGGNSIAGELYGSSSLNEALLDHFEYKLEHLLKWEDRNSMWFSLESRVPFLDYRLVERILASSPDKKIRNGMTKHILRESMKGTLPEKIRMRKDKIGFLTPENEWFREEKFKTFIMDLLDSDSFKSRNIIDPEKAKALYREHLEGRKNISKEIWKWINLELWFREFID